MARPNYTQYESDEESELEYDSVDELEPENSEHEEIENKNHGTTLNADDWGKHYSGFYDGSSESDSDDYAVDNDGVPLSLIEATRLSSKFSSVIHDPALSISNDPNKVHQPATKGDADAVFDMLLTNLTAARQEDMQPMTHAYLREFEDFNSRLEKLILEAQAVGVPALSAHYSGSCELTDKGFALADGLVKMGLWASMVVSEVVRKPLASCAPVLLELDKAITKFEHVRKKSYPVDQQQLLAEATNPVFSEELLEDCDADAISWEGIEEPSGNHDAVALATSSTLPSSDDRPGPTADSHCIPENEAETESPTIAHETDVNHNSAEPHETDEDEVNDAYINEIEGQQAYEATKLQSDRTTKLRAQIHKAKQMEKLPKLPATLQDDTDARLISKEIEQNRGLTRKRAKYSGHARVHNRMKYRKKIIKLSGSTMKGMEAGPSGDYSGEAAGITTHVTRGRRLN